MFVVKSFLLTHKKFIRISSYIYFVFFISIAGIAYGDESAVQEPLSANASSHAHEPQFYRCTAQNDSYSVIVRNNEPCPSETDDRKYSEVRRAVGEPSHEEFEAQIREHQRQVREFSQYSGETDEHYKARMEASQNPLWLEDQKNRARQVQEKAAEDERSRLQEVAANQSAKNSSHFWIWLVFLLALVASAKWLWGNSSSAKPVRTAHRTTSRSNSTQDDVMGKPELLREISPPKSSPPQTSNTATNLLANQRVEKYLHAFEVNGEMPSVAYFSEIKALNLNYSAESLERLDRFLVELRHRIKPSYADLVEKPQLQQLVILLGMYLATTIARITQQSIKWFNYEDAKILLGEPNYPETVGTLVSCMLGKGYHHLPIEVICAILIEENSTESCIERLSFYRKHASPFIPIPRNSLDIVVEPRNEAERAWFQALSVAGISAAKTVYVVEGAVSSMGSSSFEPTLTVLEPESKNMTFVVLMGKSTDDAVEEMKHNPRNVPFKVLAYDGYANLPTGRMDAITLQVQTYGEFAAMWIIVIPYHPASHPDGYAFYTPLLVSSSVSADLNPMLMHAFYSGVDGMKLPDDPWNRYLQES